MTKTPRTMPIATYPRTIRVPTQAEARTKLTDKNVVIVESKAGPKCLLMKCPCGCVETLVVNLMASVGRAWQARVDRKGQLSLWPSVVRQSGCRSHFMLSHGQAYLIRGWHSALVGE